MMTNRLLRLAEAGQSVWLDNLSRPLVREGELARLVEEDGIAGVTSNPAIFRNAMTGTDAYDGDIRALAGEGLDAAGIYETLAVRDVREAAGVLRTVWDRTEGADGFVSLEVSPHLARDTDGTVAEAKRLWWAVDRPNVMIKIPGTSEGIPAIERCLAEGINVNVTLLFSRKMYGEVMEAYHRAIETRIDRGESPGSIASVASFFISRIDSKIDGMLEELDAEDSHSLLGCVAVANAKLAYADWSSAFGGERWARLERAGARVQRPLWASTSTKNPAYSDVKYVETLVGRDTVNTLPDETIAAFRDHGTVRADAVEAGLDEARDVIDRLGRLGIDLDRATHELVLEGIAKFVEPFDALLGALDAKRLALAGS